MIKKVSCFLLFFFAGLLGRSQQPAHTAQALKTIYLSFDDGPLEGSEDIDDAVKKENIKVNVFVVGYNEQSSRKHRKYYERYLHNPMIEIGNHSFSHAHNHYELFYKDPATVLADFQRNQQILAIPYKLARLPGRNMWRLKGISVNDVKSGQDAANLLFENGYRVFGWDIEWQHDAKTGVPIQTVDDMIELIEKKLAEEKTIKKDHLVILCHDEMFRNGWEESELKQLILKLKTKGNYQFEHLSKYPD